MRAASEGGELGVIGAKLAEVHVLLLTCSETVLRYTSSGLTNQLA